MSRAHQHIFYLSAALVLLAVGTGFFLSHRHSPLLVFAQDGPLEVSWTDKLFDYDNLLPGYPIETKDIVIKNTSATDDFDVYFGAIDTSNTAGVGGGLLHEKLDVKLLDSGGGEYWSGTLDDLFDIARDNGCTNKDDMAEDCAVDLGITLGAGEETTLSMSVGFDKSVGNDYQSSGVVFDMLTGFFGVGTVAAAETGPEAGPLGSVLGIATGADLLPSILGSLVALSTGLYLRRRSSSSD